MLLYLLCRLKRTLDRVERFIRIDIRYFIKGGALLSGADVLVSIFSLGVSILVAAYVPKDVYGIYKYILSIAAIAAAFSLTGINNAVTRAVASGREGSFVASLLPQARYSLLQFSVICVAALYYFYQSNHVYGVALFTIAILAPAASVLNTYVAFLNGKRDFRKMALWKVQNGIIGAAAMATVVLVSPTVLGMTIAYYLTVLITNAWCTWRTLTTYRPNQFQSKDDITYGKHLSLMNAVGIVATQIDALIVYHLLGPVALATYSFAILIPEKLRGLLSFIPSIALPKLSGRGQDELRASTKRRTIMGLVAAGGISVLYAGLAPFFFHIFFPQYIDAVEYSQLAGLFALSVVPTYLNTVLTAQGSKRALYIVSISTPVLKVVLSAVCILTMGLWGAITARLVAGAFGGTTSYFLLMAVPRGKEQLK